MKRSSVYTVVILAAVGAVILFAPAKTAHAIGVFYADPGWMHVFDGNGDYYHDPDGPNPNYLADPDPTNNQPGGQNNQPALINPGPCGGSGQPSCEDAAIWQMHSGQWEGSAPGDPLGGPPGPPPVPPPAPGGVGAFMDGSTSFLRIQDAGNPQDWGWADKGAQGSPTGARQEGNNRRILFKHEMKDDAGFSDRLDIIDFGVTISFRARLATAVTGPIDDIYAEGGTTPAPWPTDGLGYDVHTEGRGMFMVTQTGASGPGQMGFSLLDDDTVAIENLADNVGTKRGLVMNGRSNPSGSPATNTVTPATANVLEIPDDELDEWQEFWITIQKLPAPVSGNTHEMSVYHNGSLTPQTFQFILDLENEFGSGAFLGMGLSGDTRQGAFDVDFFAYKEGIHVPTLAGLDGDYNDDGAVNAADYVVYRKFFGMTSTLLNDPDVGTTIDQDQYNTWMENFGESLMGGAGGSAVPEPVSGALAFVEMLALAAGMRLRAART